MRCASPQRTLSVNAFADDDVQDGHLNLVVRVVRVAPGRAKGEQQAKDDAVPAWPLHRAWGMALEKGILAIMPVAADCFMKNEEVEPNFFLGSGQREVCVWDP